MFIQNDLNMTFFSSCERQEIHNWGSCHDQDILRATSFLFFFCLVFFSSSELNFRHEAGGLGRCPVSQRFIRRLAERKLNSFSHSILIVFTNLFVCGGFWGEHGAYERPKRSRKDCFLPSDNEFVPDRALAWAVCWSRINTYVNNNNESVIIPVLEK